jgi:hypothetical protein
MSNIIKGTAFNREDYPGLKELIKLNTVAGQCAYSNAGNIRFASNEYCFSIMLQIESGLDGVGRSIIQWSNADASKRFALQLVNRDLLVYSIGSAVNLVTYSDIFKRGEVSHLAVSLNENVATENLEVFINGRSCGKQTIAAVGLNAVYSALYVGANYVGTNNYFNGFVGSLSVFNRALTEQQVVSISQMGGVLPTSVHANCLMHLHKAEGRTWYDCVDQYNYAKTDRSLTAANSEFLDAHTWHIGEYMSIANGVFSYPGGSPGSRNSHVPFTNNALGGKIRVTVDVKSLGGSNGPAFYYGSTSWEKSYNASTVGVHTFELEYVSGATKNLFVSISGTTSTFDLERIQIEDAEKPPLNNTHATLQNFTDAEVGLLGQSRRTSLADVYSKKRLSTGALSGILGDYLTVTVPHDAKFDVGNNDFAIRLKFAFTGGTGTVIHKGNIAISINEGGKGNIRFYVSGTGRGIGQYVINPLIENRFYDIKLNKITHDVNNWTIEIDGKVFPMSVYVDNNLTNFADSTASLIIGDTAAWDRRLNNAIAELEWNVAGVSKELIYFDEVSGDRVYGESGSEGTVSIADTKKLELAGGAWVENKTGLPPIQNGLSFSGNKIGRIPLDALRGHYNKITIVIDAAIEKTYNGSYDSGAQLLKIDTTDAQDISVSMIANKQQIRTNVMAPNVWGLRRGGNIDHLCGQVGNIIIEIDLTQANLANRVKHFANGIERSNYVSVEAGVDELNFTNIADACIYFAHGATFFRLAIYEGIVGRKKGYEFSNNGFLNNMEATDALCYYLFNHVKEDAGIMKVADLSGKGHDMVLENFTADQINQDDLARTAIKPKQFFLKDFTTLIRKGLKGYADQTHITKATDSLILGDGTQSFSIRKWIYFNTVAQSSRNSFDNENVAPRMTLVFNGADSNNVVPQYAFKVGSNDAIIKGDPAAGHKITANNLYYLGFDRITNNVNNWKFAHNAQLVAPPVISYNAMVETDVLSLQNPTYMGKGYFAHDGVDGVMGMFAVFQPALSKEQSEWLYNSGAGNDPVGIEAKKMGIGIQGIDTIGTNGITTLLTRYITFDKLYSDGANEFVREHITNNNLYAQLSGYLTTDKKIGY